MKILQMGWPDISSPTRNGSQKYTVEVVKRLRRQFTVYYERMSGIRSFIQSPILLWKYRDQDVDIVHVLGPDTHGIIGVFLSWLLSKPLVVTLFAYRFDELHALNKSVIPNLVPLLLERIALNAADVVIVTSEWQRRRLPVAIMGKTIVAYPGSNISARAGRKVRRRDTAVCITGPLSRHERVVRKGVDMIFGIANLTPQLKFHIVGGTLSQIKNLGRSIPCNVQFHGYLSESQIQKLLSESKFVLAPSRHEAFGIPVLEGIMCGCIGIVSEYCGIQDILEACGRVLPLRTDVFSKSMIELLEKRREADALRVTGQKVSREFTWERTAETHARIYERLGSHEGSFAAGT